MKRNLTVVGVLAILAAACGTQELSFAEIEHQNQIETSLRFSGKGWLVEATDGVIYKVQDIISHSETSHLELIADAERVMRVTVGRGECMRCTAYFVRVVTPSGEDYATLAVRFAKQ